MNKLFVISAPSGTGKTTLCQRAIAQRDDLCYSISYTTRSPRPLEKDGRDYNFVSRETFGQMIAKGEFLEWAEVFGNYYGTGRAWVMEKMALGIKVLVDIDILGARQIKNNCPEATLVFMVPPSYDDLVARLTARHTENTEAISERLNRAAIEISQRELYDYLLINDDLDKAVDDLINILNGQPGCPMGSMEAFWPKFFANHPNLNLAANPRG